MSQLNFMGRNDWISAPKPLAEGSVCCWAMKESPSLCRCVASEREDLGCCARGRGAVGIQGCWDVGKKGCRDVGMLGCGEVWMWRHRNGGTQRCEEVRASFLTWKILTAPRTYLPCVPENESSSPCSVSLYKSHPTKFSFVQIKGNTIRKKPKQTSQQKTGCACSSLFAAPAERGSGTCLGSILTESGRELFETSCGHSSGCPAPACPGGYSPTACPSQAGPRGCRGALGARGKNTLRLPPRCEEFLQRLEM